MHIQPSSPSVTQSLAIMPQSDINFRTITLSTHQLMSRIGVTHMSPDALSRANKLLKKAHFISVFTESDRVHLLQIFQTFSLPFTENEAKGLIEWYKIVKEELGDELFSYVSNPACYAGSTHNEAMKFLQQLIEMSSNIEEFTSDLIQFYQNLIGLKDLLQRIDTVKSEIEAKKYPEKDLEEVMEAFSGNIEGSLVSVPLSLEQLSKIKDEYLQILEIGKELKSGGINHLISFVKEFKVRAKEKALTQQDKLMLIAAAREAIRIKFGIFPYNTQIMTLLALLDYPENCKGRICQARTGEGKSTIVTLLAFYHACQGYAVDVISTTRYLAARDQEKYEEFFDLFEITTSALCADNPTEDNFKGLILYGTNYDFEFAWMRDKLGSQNIRRLTREGHVIPRPLEIVIVDEVDSLFIDSALNSARISVPGRIKINWIYPPILDFVKQNKEITAKAFFGSKMSNVKEKKIMQDKVIQSLQQNLANYQGGKFKAIVEKLSSKKIDSWINSAYNALFELERKKDYDVKPVKVLTPEGAVYKDKVVIVDRKNTGTIKENSRWQKGQHEFVEVKEGLPPAEENLMPSSICHPIYFAGYQTVFGTTGTMGTHEDRKEIQDIYSVDSFDVPPHKINKRKIVEPQIVFFPNNYLKSLLNEIQFNQIKQRPTLVIFETIKETEDFHDFLKQNNIFSQVLNERQAQHEDFIIAKAGAPGMVTIATNTAGRGTDIILHPSSLKNGGLHMIFGFYPENERVETQGFGRAARQGQPGSCRIIVLFDQLDKLPIQLRNSPSAAYEILQIQRELKAKKLANSRRERFALEKINHKYLEKFYEQCQFWQKAISKEFLEKAYSLLLKKLKEKKPYIVPVSSVSVDKLTAELQKIFAYQSTHDILEDNSWMPFLDGVHSSLRTNIQQNWAESFFTELDDLQEEAKKTLPENEDLVLHYGNLIEMLFMMQREKWEKHLLTPEQGFYQYLALVCGFSEIID